MSARGRRVARALLLGIGLSVAVTVVSRVGALSGWEARALDLFLFFRDRVPAPEIALVTIDEQGFRAMGARQPLPRQRLAELVDFLLRSGARVVAVDVVVSDASVPEEDAALVTVARRWAAAAPGRIVFATRLASPAAAGRSGWTADESFSRELPVTLGFANAPAGADGMIRWAAPLLRAADDGFLPSLALAALAGYAGYSPRELGRALRGGESAQISLPARGARGGTLKIEPLTLGLLAEGAWRIDYVGPPGTLTAFPSGPVQELARSGIRPEPDNPFNGKIVFVGATFADSRDFYPTPVGFMAGVEIHANIAHTLLSRRTLLPPPWSLSLGVLVAACLAVTLLSLWLRPLWVTVCSLGLVAAFAILSYEAYTQGGYWLDFVGPLLGMQLYILGSRVQARRRLESAFGQYVSPEVMDRVLQAGAELGGEVRTVSVLMSDLRGFTTMSERLSPTQIMAIMNQYMTAMVDVVLAQKGMVIDFIGDGILAVFGAPSDDPAHAWHAVVAALEMQAALARLNGQWQAGGRSPLAMGIAVNTGEVFAGNVGAARKKKYAVMGDPVNTVSRMEGMNRELSTSILISGTTLAATKHRVEVRDRGAATVKGKARPVELFELVGLAGADQRGEDGHA